MSMTREIPADLALLLNRQVLSEYALACDVAQLAAEQCAIPDHPSKHALGWLRDCRARVHAAEHALELVSDAVAAGQPWKVSFATPERHVIATLLKNALERLSAGFESTEEEILATADSIPRLRALLDLLCPHAALPSS